jgi:hypothetical protein
LPAQDDDLLAVLAAMNKLAQLYPHTFRMLLLGAREALRPMGTEATAPAVRDTSAAGAARGGRRAAPVSPPGTSPSGSF